MVTLLDLLRFFFIILLVIGLILRGNRCFRLVHRLLTLLFLLRILQLPILKIEVSLRRISLLRKSLTSLRLAALLHNWLSFSLRLLLVLLSRPNRLLHLRSLLPLLRLPLPLLLTRCRLFACRPTLLLLRLHLALRLLRALHDGLIDRLLALLGFLLLVVRFLDDLEVFDQIDPEFYVAKDLAVWLQLINPVPTALSAHILDLLEAHSLIDLIDLEKHAFVPHVGLRDQPHGLANDLILRGLLVVLLLFFCV